MFSFLIPSAASATLLYAAATALAFAVVSAEYRDANVKGSLEYMSLSI